MCFCPALQLDELLVLDLTHWEWHKPRPSGREPVARSGHSAVLVGSDRIVFFGGWDGGKVREDVHVLQIAGDMYEDWCWQDQLVKGPKVEGRIGHGAVYVVCPFHSLCLSLSLFTHSL